MPKSLIALSQIESLVNAQSILKSSLLFAEMPDSQLEQIARLLRETSYNKGDAIFLEGEESLCIYFIVSGHVEITKINPHHHKADLVYRLGPGDYFSEFSVITDTSHSTSAFAESPHTKIYSLDKDSFHDLIRCNSTIGRSLVKRLAIAYRQMYHYEKRLEYFKKDQLSFTPEMPKLLNTHLIDKYQVIPVSFKDNCLTVAMTNPYQKMFFDIFRDMNPKIDLKVALISISDFNRYSRDVKASYASGKSAISPNLKSVSKDPIPNLESILNESDIFSKLKPSTLQWISNNAKTQTIQARTRIFSSGDLADTFYLIAKGKVELFEVDSATNAKKVALSLSQRDHFGEISMAIEGTHRFNAESTTEVVLYTLAKSALLSFIQEDEFNLGMAKIFARRIQSLNLHSHWRVYQGDLSSLQHIPTDVLPFAVMVDHKIIPLDINNTQLTLGVVRPHEEIIYQVINRYLTGYKVEITIINEGDFNRGIDEIKKRVESGTSSKAEAGKHINIAADGPKAINRDPASFISELMNQAIHHRASDIHIDPMPESTAIRYRIDGSLRELHDRLTPEFTEQVINRLKILSHLDIAEHRRPQDGQLGINTGQSSVQARIATAPVRWGEKVSLRLIDAQKGPVQLNSLAPDRNLISFLRKIIRFQQGVFLVTGPTGSGKSTTTYSLLNELNTVNLNVISVEDPVELYLPGITQIQVNEKLDLNFGKLLRTILRQDPDVLMVGEIRDSESAQIAFEAALTGKLVLATLHASDSIEVIPRLKELGVKQNTIANALIGVLNQRLLPRNCPECSSKVPVTPEESTTFIKYCEDHEIPQDLVHGKGCPHCFNEGYKGRIAVFEYWQKTPEIRQVLLSSSYDQHLSPSLRSQGFKSIDQNAMQMVRNGLTTVSQVTKHLYGVETAYRLTEIDSHFEGKNQSKVS